MQRPSDKQIRTAVMAAFFILAAALLRQVTLRCEFGLVTQAAGIARTLIHFGLFITWGLSIRRRIMQRQVCKVLTAIAGLMVFWLMVRTIKYLFISGNADITRWLWYTYYIPMLLIPVLSVFVALSLGRPESYRLPDRMGLFYLPTLLLIGLVLTNDRHQWVFSFPGAVWSDTDNGYGVGFWLVFGWMVLCALTALGIMLAKSRVPRSAQILWLPFAPLFVLVVYSVLNMLRLPIVKVVAGDMTVMFCLCIMAIFECCIQIGLIRSNSGYEELFEASGLAARVIGEDFQVRFQTVDARPLPEHIMRRAKIAPLALDENTRLSSAPIRGGHVLWLEDVSEMNALLSELREVRGQLSEKNALLEAELELKERSARVDEQNRLYDRVTQEVATQLRRLDNLLSYHSAQALPEGQMLAWLCVLGTYIKRRSNLIILSEDSALLSAKELEYCFQESAEALSECGIPCFFGRRCEGLIATQSVLALYDLFEEIVEAALPDLTALLVNLHILEGQAELKLQLSGPVDGLSAGRLRHLPRLTDRGGRLAETVEDGTLHLSLLLPQGGVRV
jgi:hypothetical protein